MRRCRNPRCREPLFYPVVLCPSCRLAGGYGVFAAAVAGAVLKLLGVL